MSSFLIVAKKEFRDDFRNRWTIAVAVLFAVLSLSISYFGGAAAGKIGFTSFDATPRTHSDGLLAAAVDRIS